MMIAFATIYEVSTHAASSTPADRLPRIWNNATFAIVVSSTSMMVASITATATSHLLAAGTLRAVWIAASGAAATGQPAGDRVIAGGALCRIGNIRYMMRNALAL